MEVCMSMEWDKINQEVEELVAEITGTLRGVDSQGKKVINDGAVKELFDLVEQMTDVLQDQMAVNKRFVALMFYLYGQIHAEARFTEYPDPLFMLAADVEDYTDKLFGRCFD
jgi:hypothetical protein